MLTSTASVHRARTLDEALALRVAHPEATVIAGGTDVMVFLEAGVIHPTAFLDLWGCRELRGIDPAGSRIGALTTWSDVARHPALPDALRACARTVGAVQIQNRGTVGGNIVNASPAGDSLPLWLALDATFVLAGPGGERRVAAEDFWTGYRATVLAPDELLVAVELPARTYTTGGAQRLHYRKVGTRLAQAISKVVLGARLHVEDGIVREARVALGSVAPVPVRARKLERALVGRAIDPDAAGQVLADIRPIDDVRSTATYRRRVTERVVRSWLAAEAASGIHSG